MNRYVQPLRVTIQSIFLLFCIYLGVRLFLFVSYIRSGGAVPFVSRPDGVEGFLPISGLMGLKDWFLSGRINDIHPAAVVIFVAVIAVSLLFRRSFCSFVCPVGTLSEVLWKLGFRVFQRSLRPPRLLDLALRSFKYLLLIFFLASIFAMSSDNLALFIRSDYHRLADVRMLSFFLAPSATAIAVIAILAVASLFLRNPLCRFLCPYGALLGLVSLVSPARVCRETEKCISCGACSQVCPSHLPVMSKEKVHSAECIACWRCISYCKVEGALQMKIFRWGVSGILFAFLVVLLFISGSWAGKATGHWKTATTPAEYSELLK